MARRKRRQWGSGSIFQRDGRWWIRWREAGRRKCKSFRSRDIAEEVLNSILDNVERGEAGIQTKPLESVATLDELAKPWLEARQGTHRSHKDDASRWNAYLSPRWGKLRPDDLTPADIRAAVEDWLARGGEKKKGLSSATCQRVTCLLSSLYTDLVERGQAKANPAKGLPRATRRLLRPTHDPRTVPFVQRPEDIRRIYNLLPENIALAYALGALAGLRVGELLALRWENVDLERRRIVVSEQLQNGKIYRPKDLDSRVVPVLDSLLPILQAARLKSGGTGQVVHSERGHGMRVDAHTLNRKLKAAIATLNEQGANLPDMWWHAATRHTFASQWVINGGSIEKLKEALGHSSVVITERYAHLRGDVFTPADLGRISVDLSTPQGKVLSIGCAVTIASSNG